MAGGHAGGVSYPEHVQMAHAMTLGLDYPGDPQFHWSEASGLDEGSAVKGLMGAVVEVAEADSPYLNETAYNPDEMLADTRDKVDGFAGLIDNLSIEELWQGAVDKATDTIEEQVQQAVDYALEKAIEAAGDVTDKASEAARDSAGGTIAETADIMGEQVGKIVEDALEKATEATDNVVSGSSSLARDSASEAIAEAVDKAVSASGTAVTEAISKAVEMVDGTPIGDVVAEFEGQEDDQHRKTLNRVSSIVAFNNATHMFPLAYAVTEGQRNKGVRDFRSKLYLQAVQQGIATYMETMKQTITAHLATIQADAGRYLQSQQTVFLNVFKERLNSLLQGTLIMQTDAGRYLQSQQTVFLNVFRDRLNSFLQSVITLQGVNRTKIAAEGTKVGMYDKINTAEISAKIAEKGVNLELDTNDALWEINVFQALQGFVSPGAGIGQNPPRASGWQKAIAGVAAVASIAAAPMTEGASLAATRPALEAALGS